MSWIDALRAYNAGMPSWCVPRKGTTAYDTIVKLRKGEKTETPKEIIDKLERKTQGKPKKEKRIVHIQLDKVVPKMEDKQEVEIPTLAEKKTRAEFQEPAAKMKKSAEKEEKKMNKISDYKYDIKKHEKTLKEFEGTTLVPALTDFYQFVSEINKERKTPIRNLLMSVYPEIKDYKTKEKTGRTLARFDRLISKVNNTYEPLATYVIEPKFEIIKKEKK